MRRLCAQPPLIQLRGPAHILQQRLAPPAPWAASHLGMCPAPANSWSAPHLGTCPAVLHPAPARPCAWLLLAPGLHPTWACAQQAGKEGSSTAPSTWRRQSPQKTPPPSPPPPQSDSKRATEQGPACRAVALSEGEAREAGPEGKHLPRAGEGPPGSRPRARPGVRGATDLLHLSPDT